MLNRKVIVYHSYYGCDTGCCGHRVEIINPDAERVYTGNGEFKFDHPDQGEDDVTFAIRLVTEEFGADHVEDLDWENCVIYDD